MQLQDLNVHTAQLSTLNFYRAWWFIKLFIEHRNTYEFEGHLCSSCLAAYETDEWEDDEAPCAIREFSEIDSFHENIEAITEFIKTKSPYQNELTEDEKEFFDLKLKEQKICFRNFNDKDYFLNHSFVFPFLHGVS